MPRALTEAEIEAFRDRLCAAATRRFAELGYEGVSMRGLAADVGCSPMTPYTYFKDKEDIFAAVRAAAFKRLADLLEDLAAQHSDPLERGRVMGDAYLDFALSEHDCYKIMFELTQPDEQAYPDLVAQVARCRRLMIQPTRTLVREGILSGEPEAVWQMFWAGVHGVIVLHLTGKLLPGTGIHDLYAEVLGALMRGVRGPNFHQIEHTLFAAPAMAGEAES
ncbi:MAG: TetR family transcriptional regulator [Alphaproteobacteria bacterium]|nr:TetR family transcriptional regulator [Alphaproteobacteria bacterium]